MPFDDRWERYVEDDGARTPRPVDCSDPGRSSWRRERHYIAGEAVTAASRPWWLLEAPILIVAGVVRFLRHGSSA